MVVVIVCLKLAWSRQCGTGGVVDFSSLVSQGSTFLENPEPRAGYDSAWGVRRNSKFKSWSPWTVRLLTGSF